MKKKAKMTKNRTTILAKQKEDLEKNIEKVHEETKENQQKLYDIKSQIVQVQHQIEFAKSEVQRLTAVNVSPLAFLC